MDTDNRILKNISFVEHSVAYLSEVQFAMLSLSKMNCLSQERIVVEVPVLFVVLHSVRSP
jgi:hypothetical protein